MFEIEKWKQTKKNKYKAERKRKQKGNVKMCFIAIIINDVISVF